MTEVPISAPIIVATARVRGITPDEVNATTMESKAPLLWMSAVAIQPAKTPLVVSRMTSTIFSARDSPMMHAEDLMRIIPEMKEYRAMSEPAAFLALSLKQI